MADAGSSRLLPWWHRPAAQAAAVVAVTLLALLPFVGKAFHMDDPLFLWAAAQIQRSPGDFYGFDVNWYGTPQPMHYVMKNPPLASYFLALAANLLGWSEAALHSASLVWPVAVTLGVWRLARRWAGTGTPAFLAALVTLASPLFFVSSTNVMCDTMMLALWVWAVVMWVEAVDEGGAWRFACAGVLIASSALTKYFGICLILLLPVYSAFQKRAAIASIVTLAIPVAALVFYQLRTGQMYGQGLLLDAFAYAKATDTSGQDPRWTKVIIGLVFAGGCVLPVVPLLPWLLTRRPALIAAVAAALVAVVMFVGWRWQPRFSTPTGPDIGRLAQGTALMSAAVFAAAIAFDELRRRRCDAPTVLLVCWLGGTWVFSTFFNWTINARTIMPMAPAIALLVARRMAARDATEVAPSGSSRTGGVDGVTSTGMTASRPLGVAPVWVVLPVFVLALAVARADRSLADAGRKGVARLAETFGGSGKRIFYQAHWGPQHYFEALGWQQLDWKNIQLEPGDIVLVADHNTNIRPLPENAIQRLPRLTVPVMQGLTTHRLSRGAGFYSDQMGPLPFAFGGVEPATFPAYLVTRPIRSAGSSTGEDTAASRPATP